MATMSCLAWPSSQSWVRLTRVWVASGHSSRHAYGMMISRNSMITNTTTAITCTDADDLPLIS